MDYHCEEFMFKEYDEELDTSIWQKGSVLNYTRREMQYLVWRNINFFLKIYTGAIETERENNYKTRKTRCYRDTIKLMHYRAYRSPLGYDLYRQMFESIEDMFWECQLDQDTETEDMALNNKILFKSSYENYGESKHLSYSQTMLGSNAQSSDDGSLTLQQIKRNIDNSKPNPNADFSDEDDCLNLAQLYSKYKLSANKPAARIITLDNTSPSESTVIIRDVLDTILDRIESEVSKTCERTAMSKTNTDDCIFIESSTSAESVIPLTRISPKIRLNFDTAKDARRKKRQIDYRETDESDSVTNEKSNKHSSDRDFIPERNTSIRKRKRDLSIDSELVAPAPVSKDSIPHYLITFNIRFTYDDCNREKNDLLAEELPYFLYYANTEVCERFVSSPPMRDLVKFKANKISASVQCRFKPECASHFLITHTLDALNRKFKYLLKHFTGREWSSWREFINSHEDTFLENWIEYLCKRFHYPPLVSMVDEHWRHVYRRLACVTGQKRQLVKKNKKT